MDNKLKLSWRVIWYSVLIWFLAIVVSGVVILPWFYLVMPLVIVGATIFYLRREGVEIIPLPKKLVRGSAFARGDRIFALGLAVSLLWFAVILVLNAIEIIGPYYSNVFLYFSDFRNWFLYPLILLTPVVYSLILENRKFKKASKKKGRYSSRHVHI